MPGLSGHASRFHRPPWRHAIGAAALVLAAQAGCRGRSQDAAPATPRPPAPIVVEADRFTAHLERSADAEQLSVSVRLRTNAPEPLVCFAFLVARTDRGAPRAWSIWPSEIPGHAISAGGHFHAAHPTTGFPLSLTPSWARVDATLPLAAGQPEFDFVVVYVVNPDGEILLARPFPLSG